MAGKKLNTVFGSMLKLMKSLPYNMGVKWRMFKFSVRGFINNPPSFGELLGAIKKALKWLVTNPKKYIPLLYILSVLILSTAYIVFLFSISAQFNRVNPPYTFGENTVVPRIYSLTKTGNNQSISLNWTDGVVELNEGRAYAKLKASTNPDYLERLGFVWESSDKEIAEVSKNGDITAKKAGNVEITVRLNGGKYSVGAKLRVVQPVTGIFMRTSNVTLYKDGTGQYLKVQFFPSDAVQTKLKWKSTNEKIVTVDSNGHIKPVGIGMCEVIAVTLDGKFSAKSFVTVTNESVKVEKVNIENGDSAEVMEGKTLNLVASVVPYNAKNKTLKWTSSNEKIVTVNQTGRVKGISEGKADIIAKSVDGVTARITVNVLKSNEADGFNLNTNDYTVVALGESSVSYQTYPQTLPMLAELQMGLSPAPKIWKNGSTQSATLFEVVEYLNPANYCDDVYKYQFLDLSAPNGVSEEALNAYLSDKGVLSGMGGAFIRAANEYNISEVYLVAHACLETGNGTSTLSRGVTVNGQTVYNMYGIGAYDNSALYSGSQKAYKEGWTSIESAIIGGARWISTYYVNSPDGRQNTLYKMLWNPQNPGTHQYATDVGWAVKQAQSISGIFKSFPDANVRFEVPVYSGQTAPNLNN